jgi:hypothetical protein
VQSRDYESSLILYKGYMAKQSLIYYGIDDCFIVGPSFWMAFYPIGVRNIEVDHNFPALFRGEV